MEPLIKHRRLYAFYRSKVLNALMLVIVVNLLLIGCTKSILLPAICGSIALLFFIGYSFWLWFKRPKRIVINNWLSSINGYYTLYSLFISLFQAPNQWWWILPIAFSVVLLFISMINNHDEQFEI